jgi:hypothetical protein
VPTPAFNLSEILTPGAEVYVLSMIDEAAGEPVRGHVEGVRYLDGGLPGVERVVTAVSVNVAGVPFNVSPRELLPVGA